MSLAITQSEANFERFVKRLRSFDIGKAKTTALSFKNLDKLSIPASFSGLTSLSNFKTSSSEVGGKANFWFCFQKYFMVCQK